METDPCFIFLIATGQEAQERVEIDKRGGEDEETEEQSWQERKMEEEGRDEKML